jgi:two-component system phosphate regulon response regulator OmpR
MRLRKIVEPDPAMPRYIQTVRGHGYMFVPQAPASASASASAAARAA